MSASRGILSKAVHLVVLTGLAMFATPAGAQTGTTSNTLNQSCLANSNLDSGPVVAAESAAQAISSAGGASLTSEISAWKNKRETCKDRNYTAQQQCYEACSKHAQGAQSGAGAIGSMINILTGLTNQTCNQQGDAAQTLQNGYQNYTAACKTAQSACNESCGKEVEETKKAIEAKLKTACASAKNASSCAAQVTALQNALKMDDKTDSAYIAGKKQQCEKEFSSMMNNAAQLLGELGKMLAGAKKCDEDSDSSSDDAATADATLDCSVEPNRSSNKTCICQWDPRRSGCENAEDFQSADKSSFGSDPSETALKSATDSVSNQNNAENIFPTSAADGAGGAGVGGGYVGGNSGAAGGTSSNAEKGKEKKGLSANVLSGEESGGGGGGGGWSFNSAGAGAENGKRTVSGGLAPNAAGGQFSNQVTGPGGRDNFLKVKTRYVENQPTFELNAASAPSTGVLTKGK
ncbi:MAG: hypothetical protein KF802_10090 [Bdellovibrionaceae bacterium]|nr:hypothetical protein [Pseudobdellovibrionaceae bacterium]MBX3033761.1 hypothetical protein [Pseudobdellovibrionaceae bacterium]